MRPQQAAIPPVWDVSAAQPGSHTASGHSPESWGKAADSTSYHAPRQWSGPVTWGREALSSTTSCTGTSTTGTALDQEVRQDGLGSWAGRAGAAAPHTLLHKDKTKAALKPSAAARKLARATRGRKDGSSSSSAAAAVPSEGRTASVATKAPRAQPQKKAKPAAKPALANAFELLGIEDSAGEQQQGGVPIMDQNFEEAVANRNDTASAAGTPGLPVTTKKEDNAGELGPAVPYSAKLLENCEDEMDEGLLSIVTCSISHDIMRDPVICNDGHTYDRGAIQMWLVNHDTSPMTGEPLSSKKLVPNMALRDLVRQFFS